MVLRKIQKACHTVDVKSAYLKGAAIVRDIYLAPPSEFHNGCLWKLEKTVYGLCDAAREWYMRVEDELHYLSVKMCPLDTSLFMWMALQLIGHGISPL